MQLRLFVLATLMLLNPASSFADTWTTPQPLAGRAQTGQTFVDFNGNLFFNSTSLASSGAQAGRNLRQSLTSQNTISEAVLNPDFVTNAGINQKGDSSSITHDINGDRILSWFINNNSSAVMAWQSASGAFGSNLISLGGTPASIAFRNNLVVVMFTNPNGTVVVREWQVGSDGRLTSSGNGTELIDAEFSACGGAVALDSDGSGVAIFKAGLEIRSATRSTAGVWSLDPAVIDFVTKDVQSIGCAYAKSSPGGRMIAGWWITSVGLGASVDRGGDIRALVREPATPMPSSFRTLQSANPDLVSGNKRRDLGVGVAMGLDGTAGILSYSKACINGGTVLSSTGILSLAAPGQSFATADTVNIGAMDSGANKIFAPIENHVPAQAFAVENNRAIIGTRAVAYTGIGTDQRSSCGAGQQVFDAQLTTANVTTYDGTLNVLNAQEVGSKTTQVGHPDIPGDPAYRNLEDAAIDTAGHLALVRSDFGALSDVILSGNWQSGGSSNPPVPTATPGDPQVALSNGIRTQISQALELLAVARKVLPAGNSKKAKASRSVITKARKDLNALMATLTNRVKVESAAILISFKNFTDKNLKAVKAAIKSGASSKLTGKQNAAGWKNAKTLLQKLIS